MKNQLGTFQQRYYHKQEIIRYKTKGTENVYYDYIEIGDPNKGKAIYFDARFVRSNPFLYHLVHQIPYASDYGKDGEPNKANSGYSEIKECLTIPTIQKGLESLGIIATPKSGKIDYRLSTMISTSVDGDYDKAKSDLCESLSLVSVLSVEDQSKNDFPSPLTFTLSGKWPSTFEKQLQSMQTHAERKEILSQLKANCKSKNKVRFVRFKYADNTERNLSRSENTLSFQLPLEKDSINAIYFQLSPSQCETMFSDFKGPNKTMLLKAFHKFENTVVSYTYQWERMVHHIPRQEVDVERVLENQVTAVQLIGDFVARYSLGHGAFISYDRFHAWKELNRVYASHHMPIPDAYFDVWLDTLSRYAKDKPNQFETLKRVFASEFKLPERPFILYSLLDPYIVCQGDVNAKTPMNMFGEPIYNYKAREKRLAIIFSREANAKPKAVLPHRRANDSLSLAEVHQNCDHLAQIISETNKGSKEALLWEFSHMEAPYKLNQIINKGSYPLFLPRDASESKDPLNIKAFGGYYPSKLYNKFSEYYFVPLVDCKDLRASHFRETRGTYFVEGLVLGDTIKPYVKEIDSDPTGHILLSTLDTPIAPKVWLHNSKNGWLEDVDDADFVLIDEALQRLERSIGDEFRPAAYYSDSEEETLSYPNSLVKYQSLTHPELLIKMITETYMAVYRSLDTINKKSIKDRLVNDKYTAHNLYFDVNASEETQYRQNAKKIEQNIQQWVKSSLEHGKQSLEHIKQIIENNHDDVSLEIIADKDTRSYYLVNNSEQGKE